ncbi:MAG TPA: hypothetical protein VNQ77_04915 [Frankiaceae bacterium]|nr:hypothetical protein [Frankiaceae bacterium]
MTTTAAENLPSSWDAARDVPFFRITARVFSPDFCLGAGVLLAANDQDDTRGSRTTTPATIDTAVHADRDLVPVRARRTR